MEAAMRKIGNLYMFTVGDKKITNCNLPQQPTKKERRFTTTPRELFCYSSVSSHPRQLSLMPFPSVFHCSLKRCSHLAHDCIARERPQSHRQNSNSGSLFCHAQRELVINRSDQNHSLCWFFLLSLSTLTIHAQPFLNTCWANYNEQERQCIAQFWEGGQERL